MKLALVMLGPPASGKGTQACRIASAYNMPMLALGDLIRYEIKDETVLGKKVRSFVIRGSLIPDEIVIDIFKKRFENNYKKASCVIDGFPRTVRQAQILDKSLKSYDSKQFFF